MKKKIIIIICISTILLTVIFLLMQISTNNLMKEVENSFLSTDLYITEKNVAEYSRIFENSRPYFVVITEKELDDNYNKNINIHFNRLLSTYGVKDYLAKGYTPDNFTIQLDIHRIVTINNFFEGELWFEYSIETYGPDGKYLAGSSKIPVRLKIKRENWKWKVVEIFERP